GRSRVCCKGLRSAVLLLGEGAHGFTRPPKAPDRRSFPHQGPPQEGAITANPLPLQQCIFWIGEHIGALNGRAFKQGASRNRASPWRNRMLFHELLELA